MRTMRRRILFAVAVAAASGAPLAAADPAAHRLAPCADPEAGERVECGSLRVWEERERGGGRTLDLRLMVFRQLGDGPAREPIFLLAGGPGQGGTDLAELVTGPFEELRQERDLVVVDLRGTGAANPLECDIEEAAERPQVVFDHLFDPEIYRRCAERLRAHADLTLYTTPRSMDDLDDVRSWLGYDRIVLWGASFGTRAALVYLRRHPQRVAAAVLDSPAPPGFRAPLFYAREAQRVVDKIFDACMADASCRGAFPHLRREFLELVERLDDEPAEVTFEDPLEEGREITVRMSRGAFGYALRGMLYRTGSYRRLPAQLHAAAVEADLAPFAAAYWARSRLLEEVVTEGLHISTLCAEDTLAFTKQEAAAATRGTFLGDYLVRQYRGACEVWDVGAAPAGYERPVSAAVPVLVLSGDLDPTTPPSWGRETARTLANALHVTVEKVGHGVSFSDCGRALTLQFLRTHSLDGLDARCGDQGAMEFELEAD